MLNVPSSVKSLYQTDGVRKNFRVHFPNGEFADITNDNVVSESVKFTESLCSQSVFKFGLAEASVLEFETVGIGNMYGMTIEASIEIDCSSLSAADKATIAAGTWDGTWDAVNEVFGIPLGTFRVDKCPRNHGAMAHRQVTAYTPQGKSTIGLAGLPTDTFYTGAKVSPNAISAIYGQGLSAPTVLNTSQDSSPEVAFFDSTGQCYMVMLRAPSSSDPASQRCAFTTFQPLQKYDFAKITLPYDMNAYYQQGVSAATALTNAGYDFTYDSNGHKIYNDNLEALQSRLPWLFSPVLTVGMRTSNYDYFRGTAGYYNIKSGQLFAIPYLPDYFSSGAAALIPQGGYELSNIYYRHWGTSDSAKRAYLGIAKLSSTGTITTLGQVQFEGYDTSQAPTIEAYTIAASPYRIKLEGSALNRNDPTLYQLSGTSTLKYIALPAYAESSADIFSLFTSWVELNGQFCKTNRTGEDVIMTLDPSTRIAVGPSDYSEMWWDEYDVDPIGTVAITYRAGDENGNEQESSVEISIGNGQSRYDMSNNEVLKSLERASLYEVTALINSLFKPQTGKVAFTPTELTMQGWPWLEAGDALEITAEDGTIVETYALRVEMSGIQHLQSVITAEGGEIIEEVS